MQCWRTLAMPFGRMLLAAIVMAATCGCALVPPNSFLDPTKVGQFPIDSRESGIRRILSPRETPPGVANAVEPTPEDVVAVYEDYRLVAGDVVAYTIQDLLTSGQPYAAQAEVTASGEIRIPDLGSVKVAGLTEQEVEQEVAARLKEGGLLPRPVVVVSVQLKRGRIFSILGAIRQAGPYPINDPDLRLLEAFSMAGDADANARRAYVIRRESTATAEPSTRPETPIGEGLVIPPPEEEGGKSPGAFASFAGFSRPAAQTTAPGQPPSKEELADVMAPQSRPASRASDAPARTFEPLVIFDPQTGALLPAEPQARNAEPAAPALPNAPQPEDLETPFEWEKAEGLALAQRVIAIDVTELRSGNPRYNIVVRDRDVINIPVDTGVFYVLGEINRPGVYSFGGRDITVKQALAVAGGFSVLAWPQRCELVRREAGTDKQVTRTVNLDAIFAGLEDDFFLRDDDILNIGTHIVAPFLYVIRNSFRFTYGFGFVYDRNFADVDAYSTKINPQQLALQRKAQRGLPF